MWTGRLWKVATAADLEQIRKDAEAKAKKEAEARAELARKEAEAKAEQERKAEEAKKFAEEVAKSGFQVENIIGMGIDIKKYVGKETDFEIPSLIYNIPVKSISRNAFANNTSLTSITIPDSIIFIGNNAFSGCTNLTSVMFQGKIAKDGIDPKAFLGDLRAKYLAGGAGTYTRPNGNSTTWKKSK